MSKDTNKNKRCGRC